MNLGCCSLFLLTVCSSRLIVRTVFTLFVIVFCKVDFSLKFLYHFYECGNNFWKQIIPKYCTAFIELMENVCIKFALLVQNNAWYVIGSGYILGINNIAPWILLLLMFGYSTLKKKTGYLWWLLFSLFLCDTLNEKMSIFLSEMLMLDLGNNLLLTFIATIISCQPCKLAWGVLPHHAISNHMYHGISVPWKKRLFSVFFHCLSLYLSINSFSGQQKWLAFLMFVISCLCVWLSFKHLDCPFWLNKELSAFFTSP